MLERAGASGRLEASAREGRAMIAIREGRVVAIEAPMIAAPRIGNVLSLDAAAVDRAAGEHRGVRIGEVLVRAGLAGQGAVAHALRVQLRARVRALARWSAIELRLERRAVESPVHIEPGRAGDLLIGAMRDALGIHDERSIRSALGAERLTLTPLGESLCGGAPLWPDEEAAVALLRRSASPIELERSGASSLRALRLVLALRWLEGAAPPPGSASAALLARKARELRRGTSAEALLDLPRGATASEARRAWRRLAGSLHPDRFPGGGALAEIAALTVAEINQAASRVTR